jgi:tRNA A37 threonylcarbamoyladenosine modification protein TsaB
VGLATAQGLTLPDGRAVFGIPTLAAMAESLRREGWFGEALCLLDAQRGECFVGHYLVREEGCESLGEVRILKPEAFPGIVRGPVLCLGPAALRYESAIREALGARALFPLSSLHRPRASSVASLARGVGARENDRGWRS